MINSPSASSPSRIAALDTMRSITPSHGPIRTHTPNRPSSRDAPYPSPSVRATPQTPLCAIPTRSGVSNVALQGQSSAPTASSKAPCLTPSLSRTSTPVASHNSAFPALPTPTAPVNANSLIPAASTLVLAPTAPAPSFGDLGIAIDVLPGYENLGELALYSGMDLDHTAWWDRSVDDDIPAQLVLNQSLQARPDSHVPSSLPGEREGGTNRTSPASRPTLLGSCTLAAPTSAEYAINTTQEIKRVMDVKKKRGEAGNIIKGIRSITGYTDTEQSCFFIMRVIMLYVWIAKIPWAIEDTEVIELAKVYVAPHTDIDLTEVVTTDFVKTITGPLKNRTCLGFDIYKNKIASHLLVVMRSSSGRFNTELVGNVMATLMFRSAKKIGILFLDKMMQDDDPLELNRVLRIVAKPGLDGLPRIPTIIDTSPQARRGPSISAIAFTCIHIYHALERLKEPVGRKVRKGWSKSGEFCARELEKRWARYVRELAQHPNLGEIRGSLLQRLQKEYIRQCPREEGEQPLGSDHLW
ncbi:unnamed protein product [Rhizoctonia solani]|uniref:Uncharacterized protein n=1 Tax=Rhizoctonia solani TaxID=456999 RepID=A0A8H3HXG3_9AGAM|nr:unnamed protein product [Rhizoctonia solani]